MCSCLNHFNRVRCQSCVVIILVVIFPLLSRTGYAQCLPNERCEGLVSIDRSKASVAMLPTGEFIISYQSPIFGKPAKNDILVQRFNADGTFLGTAVKVSAQTPSGVFHKDASLSITPNAKVVVAWIGEDGAIGHGSPALVENTFDFFDYIITPLPAPLETFTNDTFPSAGAARAASEKVFHFFRFFGNKIGVKMINYMGSMRIRSGG